MRIIGLIIILFFSFNKLQAQSLKEINIDSVFVYAKKSIKDAGITKTVVDSTALSESVNGSMADIISKFSPVFVKSYGSGSEATVSFRGTAPSHTSVVWNGITINNPMAGYVDFSLIPTWFVDNIELYHGGSSMQSGSNALGGTVVLDSKARWDRKFYGSLIQNIGSFGSYQTLVSAGGGSKNIQLRVRYLYEQADNDFKYYNNAYPPFEIKKQTNAFFRKNGITADLFIKNNKGDVFSVSSWYNDSGREVPPIMSYQGMGRDEHQNYNELRISAKWNRYRERYKSSLIVGYNSVKSDYSLSNKSLSGDILSNDSESKTNSITSNYNFDYNLSKSTLLKVGADINFHSVDTYDKVTDKGYDKNRFEAAVWASIHHKFFSKLAGFALIREEMAGRDFSSVMPSLGLDYSPLKSDNLHITLNATRNYHLPTLNDMYWVPGGNPNLKREKGYSTDLSAAYEVQKGSFSFSPTATIYYSSIDDWIIWQPGDYYYWTAENIKRVVAKGVEISGYANFKSKTSSFKSGVTVNYAYTNSQNRTSSGDGDESVGKQLIYIPLHKLSAMLDISYRNYYLYYVYSYNSERFTTSSNEATRHKLSGYAINNATIGKNITFRHNFSLVIEAKINNIFDIDYQAVLWRAMPKRNYQLSAGFNF